MTDVQVVWYKRDLRVGDHAPLAHAAGQGPCLCLYVYEPELLAAEEHDPSHLVFVNESLAALDAALHERGGRLVTRVGRMPDARVEARPTG